MTLLYIVLATLAGGLLSVLIAAKLTLSVLGRLVKHLVSLSAGVLLGTALLHVLPEAFESKAPPQALFATLLGGLLFFWLLDKAELWHHGHEHNHDHGHADHGHAHHHHGDTPAKGGGWAVLTGDSVHCFGDGILIASAFIADLRLGAVAALAVLAHEVPHHMGDLIVLRQSSRNRSAALVKVSLAGAVTALGGIAGFFLVEQLHDYLPYFLVVASSSFVYVALADLIPQLQKRLSARQTAAQIAWLLVGIALVTLVSGLAHAH
jgi:zinc and cadmium transporter